MTLTARIAAATAALALLVTPLLAPPAHARGADPAVARTHALIAAFKKVKKPAKGKSLSAADKAANAAAFKALDGFYDRASLVGTPIAKHKGKFNKAQLKRFEDSFFSLIRLISDSDSARYFTKSKWTVKTGKAKGGITPVTVHAVIASEDTETDVVFQWKKVGGALKIVDVSFDGASMLRDYGAQFGKLIGKRGVDGLLKKLDKKLAKERKRRAGMLP